MRADPCREWRESLGAYALGQLAPDEVPALEAHLEGCADCRAELVQLQSVARLMERVDPERLEEAPTPPPELADRVFTAISGERRAGRRRRRLRLGFAIGGATAAVAAAVLAIFVLPGGGDEPPSRIVSFEGLPQKLKIGAKLEPRAFGTEIHMYVKGAPSGALCRVFLQKRDGTRLSAGSFRYRWSKDSYPILSSALDLSRTEAIGVRVGRRTFVARLGPAPAGSASRSPTEGSSA
jgi:hypothetical protein